MLVSLSKRRVISECAVCVFDGNARERIIKIIICLKLQDFDSSNEIFTVFFSLFLFYFFGFFCFAIFRFDSVFVGSGRAFLSFAKCQVNAIIGPFEIASASMVVTNK